MRTLQQKEMHEVNKYTEAHQITAETADRILISGIRGVLYKLQNKFNLVLSRSNTNPTAHKPRI
jgi:hypothetical protein